MAFATGVQAALDFNKVLIESCSAWHFHQSHTPVYLMTLSKCSGSKYGIAVTSQTVANFCRITVIPLFITMVRIGTFHLTVVHSYVLAGDWVCYGTADFWLIPHHASSCQQHSDHVFHPSQCCCQVYPSQMSVGLSRFYLVFWATCVVSRFLSLCALSGPTSDNSPPPMMHGPIWLFALSAMTSQQDAVYTAHLSLSLMPEASLVKLHNQPEVVPRTDLAHEPSWFCLHYMSI
jgi:hypothetical protein